MGRAAGMCEVCWADTATGYIDAGRVKVPACDPCRDEHGEA